MRLTAAFNGSQAVVTFWELVIEGNRVVMRCVAYFNESMQQTGDLCAQPKGEDQ